MTHRILRILIIIALTWSLIFAAQKNQPFWWQVLLITGVGVNVWILLDR